LYLLRLLDLGPCNQRSLPTLCVGVFYPVFWVKRHHNMHISYIYTMGPFALLYLVSVRGVPWSHSPQVPRLSPVPGLYNHCSQIKLGMVQQITCTDIYTNTYTWRGTRLFFDCNSLNLSLLDRKILYFLNSPGRIFLLSFGWNKIFLY
jgi:hypothetical protein